MKILKFTTHLIPLILSGQKTSTWRLFDDKNLSVGDDLEFINKETGESFAKAKIVSIKIKTLGSLAEDDWKGHERFINEEEMYKAYRNYYGEKVNKDSELKIINFNLI